MITETQSPVFQLRSIVGCTSASLSTTTETATPGPALPHAVFRWGLRDDRVGIMQAAAYTKPIGKALHDQDKARSAPELELDAFVTVAQVMVGFPSRHEVWERGLLPLYGGE